jgi:Transposase IS4
MQKETSKKLQGPILAIRALLYLSPALLLLESWLIPPMAMERKMGEEQTRHQRCSTVAAAVDAPQGPTPTVVVHDTAWYEDDQTTKLPINGQFAWKNWHVTNIINVHFGEGSDTKRRLSRLDYLLMMYPPEQIAMIQLTNALLRIHHKNEVTRGELIRFFGTMILATRFQFNNRHNLWSTEPRTRLLGAPMLWREDRLLAQSI